jgi:hypothetical protein
MTVPLLRTDLRKIVGGGVIAGQIPLLGCVHVGLDDGCICIALSWKKSRSVSAACVDSRVRVQRISVLSGAIGAVDRAALVRGEMDQCCRVDGMAQVGGALEF